MAQPDQSAIVVVKAYDFTLWLLPKVEKFNRSLPVQRRGPGRRGHLHHNASQFRQRL